MVDSIKKHSYVKHDAANNVLLVCIINHDNSFLLYSFQARVRFVNSGKYTCKLQVNFAICSNSLLLPPHKD